MLRSGGEILVAQLRRHGVDRAFCVPGESYLPVLDALVDTPIALTICRQEGGAAMMAEAHGKLTGRPGICLVTRAPGATNALAGLHVAMHDATPMILFVGQVDGGVVGRGAFQEVDYRVLRGELAKDVIEVGAAARLPELISRAFHVAVNGRPGPVVVVLPEDVLRDRVDAGDAEAFTIAAAGPPPSDIARLGEMLALAERPVVIAGGSGWDQASVDALVRFAERQSLPVAVSFRRQGLFPASHPHFIGDLSVGCNPALAARVRDADCIVLLGGRLAEIPSQDYSLIDIPVPRQALVHIYPDPEEIGRVYRPNLAFATGPSQFLSATADIPPPVQDRLAHVRQGRADYLAWSETPPSLPGAFDLGRVLCDMRATLPDDAIICNGAGNYATWVHRFHRFERFGTQLAPTSGSMGYGVPAAVAAQLAFPARTVIAFAGDGCFLMHGQEFATAVQYGLPIVVVVVDNGMYGTIRMHQERTFPGRVIGTSLINPDFVAYARAFGGHGERVERTDDFAAAFDRARASGLPSILHCIVDPEALTPGASLSAIRERALEQVRG